MPNEYDPKLKAAANEIDAVLKRYDIGGAMNLVSQTHGEFLISFPTWSGITKELDENGVERVRVRIKGKGEQEKAEGTVHLIVSNLQMFDHMSELFKNLFDLLKEKALIGFSSPKITPHRPDMDPK